MVKPYYSYVKFTLIGMLLTKTTILMQLPLLLLLFTLYTKNKKVNLFYTFSKFSFSFTK